MVKGISLETDGRNRIVQPREGASRRWREEYAQQSNFAIAVYLEEILGPLPSEFLLLSAWKALLTV